MLTKLRAWASDLWDKHGSKILFSASGLCAGWQSMILAGFITASNFERRIVAFIIVYASVHGVGRSLGTAPKSDATPPKV